MRPFFSYFGAKWRAAPKYPRPEHETIIEPFAGAAGYSTRYFRRKVVLVEKSPVIAGLWDFLIRASVADVLAIPMLREGQRVPEMKTHDAGKALVSFWVNQGTAVPHHQASTWAKLHPENYWSEPQRARIAAQCEQIRHWKIVHGSYENAPDVEATWFVDPPYEKAGFRYAEPSKNIDFPALGSWCRERRGLVMVCENDDATWLPFSPLYDMRGQKKKSVEALWVERNPR